VAQALRQDYALELEPKVGKVEKFPKPIALKIEGVSKSLGEGKNRTEVLDNIDVSIYEGEFVAILGFSGSGKSTLINLMAGLEQADRGVVRLKDKVIHGPGLDRGVVFQNYALMPWLTVEENVRLAVDQAFPSSKVRERTIQTEKYLEMVHLSTARHKRPAELSGGMRQRVAVARALAMEPEMLLMDEPLSALDALTRSKLQQEILNIWEIDRRTVVLVTNDVDEALLMADRVIPLNPGPNASLGPDFEVNLPRPRDKRALNHDPDYQKLRNDVIGYLMDVKVESISNGSATVIQLPNVQPLDRRNSQNQRQPKLPEVELRSHSERQLERFVEFDKVTKEYPTEKGGKVAVVEEFDLCIKKGEFVSLIGHSGCGKSTVLSMLAGLTDVSAGNVILDNQEITTTGTDRGIVFQAPSLMPWLTAAANVALGVETVYPHSSKQERKDIVDYYLNRVGLYEARNVRSVDLSNSMQQRVGIARAFALSPKMLLLDEPFGMADSLTRWDLQEVLMEVWERTKVTTLMVTHDVDEAVLLSDRVVMMTNGPRAHVGQIETIDPSLPRIRKQLLTNSSYYEHRDHLLQFLEDCEQSS